MIDWSVKHLSNGDFEIIYPPKDSADFARKQYFDYLTTYIPAGKARPMTRQEAEAFMKKYTVYKFPSYFGTPKHFKFKIIAWLYAITRIGYICELRNNHTNEYTSYWT